MNRRQFITLLGGAAAWPLAARAQQGERIRRIAMLVGSTEDDQAGQTHIAAFRDGLAKLGWSKRATFGLTCALAAAMQGACEVTRRNW